MFDHITEISRSIVQHGSNNDRIYLMKLHPEDDVETVIDQLVNLATVKQYSKIFAKVPEGPHQIFLNHDFQLEATVDGLYNGNSNGHFLGRYFSEKRSYLSPKEKHLIDQVRQSCNVPKDTEKWKLGRPYTVQNLAEDDVSALAKIYQEVFQVYPFPIFDKKYLLKTMAENVRYYGVFKDDKLIAVSSAEMDVESGNAEMTDFATSINNRGQNLSSYLLQHMIEEMRRESIQTLFTIARATSHGMNKTFGRQGFYFGGTLINNTLIGSSIESMNVWFKNI